MESPIVAPELYEDLPDLTTRFSEVYVRNTIGDGYSLAGAQRSSGYEANNMSDKVVRIICYDDFLNLRGGARDA
jgi:hypothetical protein